jgi:hypothetical protein
MIVHCEAAQDVLRSRRSHSSRGKEWIMNLKTIAIVVAAFGMALSAALPAAAEDAVPDTAGGRYIFSKIADGFVRLDTQTGAVSQCSQREVGWACVAAADDRTVLESEIARLRGENAALKKDVLSRGLPLPPGVMPEPPLAQNGEPQNTAPNLRLPSDAELDRMMAFIGRVWHRFVDAIDRAQKQILNKS